MVEYPCEYPGEARSTLLAGSTLLDRYPCGAPITDHYSLITGDPGLFATDLDAEPLHEIRNSTHGGYAIGDSRFREEIERALNRRATPRGPGRPDLS
jgi:hypothetical protein